MMRAALTATVGAVVALVVGYFVYAVRLKFAVTFVDWVSGRWPHHTNAAEPYAWFVSGALIGLAIDYIRKH